MNRREIMRRLAAVDGLYLGGFEGIGKRYSKDYCYGNFKGTELVVYNSPGVLKRLSGLLENMDYRLSLIRSRLDKDCLALIGEEACFDLKLIHFDKEATISFVFDGGSCFCGRDVLVRVPKGVCSGEAFVCG